MWCILINSVARVTPLWLCWQKYLLLWQLMAEFRVILELLNEGSKLRVVHRRESAQGARTACYLREELFIIIYLNFQPWFRLSNPTGEFNMTLTTKLRRLCILMLGHGYSLVLWHSYDSLEGIIPVNLRVHEQLLNWYLVFYKLVFYDRINMLGVKLKSVVIYSINGGTFGNEVIA